MAGSSTWKSGALDAFELASPVQPPPLTVHSAVALVPRASGVTAVSRALVAAAPLPPHSAAPASQVIVAVAIETLTGPLTAAGSVLKVLVAARSVTSVPEVALHSPPLAVQFAEPFESRTPVMSPDAAPVVSVAPVPLQVGLSQSTFAVAFESAVNTRPAGSVS
ncbi:hypothetical protein, partial [Pseudonocardia sp. TRM90224]|uniref:hypothetical protein n=1 Tax=Pseudonocardia sp. TRM90224 TaxID=2812678 RepID=UPI001E3D5C24